MMDETAEMMFQQSFRQTLLRHRRVRRPTTTRSARTQLVATNRWCCRDCFESTEKQSWSMKVVEVEVVVTKSEQKADIWSS
jgi:hypothetical protein